MCKQIWPPKCKSKSLQIVCTQFYSIRLRFLGRLKTLKMIDGDDLQTGNYNNKDELLK